MKDWLSAAAISRPDGAAVILPDGSSIIYADLQRLCITQAAILATNGVGQGTHVAVLMENSLRYVVLVHAMMRLGAILIPLNTRLTGEELRYQLETSRTNFLCFDEIHQEIADTLQSSGRKLIDCTGELGFGAEGQSYPSNEINLNAVCAIVFTSGTTGKSKGVQLTYGNFLYSAMASGYRLGVLPDDRWLICLPMFHVGGLSILYRSCLYNTAVVLYQGTFDPLRIVIQNNRDRVTMLSVVPTQLYRLLQVDDSNLVNLRLILLGGAAANSELLKQSHEKKLNIAATYGLTEATSQVATALPDKTYVKQGSVGRPLPFMSICVLDGEGQELPAGEIGEISVSGPTIMRGYLGQPDLAPDTIFHTGDIGYLDSDGDLYILQRRSDLIISGGENIYPAEVENALREHSDVADAVVIGLPDAEWGQRVAAAIILQKGSTLTTKELSRVLAEKLARYKTPRNILFVEAFPLTASGKVDRRAVAALFSP